MTESARILAGNQAHPGGYMRSKRANGSFNAEADRLYFNFKKPSHAMHNELTDGDVIVHYAGNMVIGDTILHASKR